MGELGEPAVADRGCERIRWRGCGTCASARRALREEQSGEEIWRWDTLPTDRIDVDGRWAHQPVRRIYFAEIDPVWLRELAKRWARA